MLLVETADRVATAYFKSARDALYAKRKLAKIFRLAFRDGEAYRFAVEKAAK